MSVADNFAAGANAVFMDQMYEMYKEDPNSVHSSWRAYFDGLENDVAEPYQPPPSLGKAPQKGQATSIDAVVSALKETEFFKGATVYETS